MSKFHLFAGAVAAATGLASTAAAEDGWTLQSAAGDPARVSLSGSFRARYESLGGQFRPGRDGGDQLITLRTTVLGEIDLDPVALGAELYDSRAYLADADGAVGTGEVNALEVPQLYVRLRLGDAGRPHADLTAGRFTMELGARRLVGRNNFRNTTNAFTGVKLDWKGTDGDALTAFYTLPQTRLPDDKPSILDNQVAFDRESWDLRFWGLYYTTPSLPAGARGEAFFLKLDEDDAAGVPTRNRDLSTVGGRLYRSPKGGAFDFEAEAGWQTGSARGSSSPADVTDLDVDAAYLHLALGRTFEAPWSPRLAFEYDFASGDADPADGEYGRFDSLYGPRRGDFGPTGIYGPLGRSNIVAPGLRLEVKPSKRWDGFVGYKALWLDEARDAFANTGVRDGAGASDDFAGHQVEARARYWIVPKRVRLDFGGAWLATGDFLDSAPNATGEGDTVYGYVDVTTTF